MMTFYLVRKTTEFYLKHVRRCSEVCEGESELHVRRGLKDDSEIFLFYFSMKTLVVTPLGETVLMRGRNACFM